LPPLRIVAGGTDYFQTLSAAYAATVEGVAATIEARAVILPEDFELSREVPLTLSGGFDEGYSASPGFTVLHGTLALSKGSLKVSGLIIE
jgi:hypothetical protein